MADLPASSVALIATVLAALIAGAFQLANLVLSKEQKVSEFRQAWIDSLRADVASWCAGARAFVRSVQEHQASAEITRFSITDQQISDIRYKAGITRYGIRLRLNRNESEQWRLAELIDEAIKVQNDFLQGKGTAEATLNAIDAIGDYASTVLKTEWERVKQGEDSFRDAKRLASAVFFSGLALVFLIWMGLINI